MKVFFLGPKTPKEYPWFNKIIKNLEKQGHQVYSDWMNVSADEDQVNLEKTYKQNLTWIKASDFVVAEISSASRGVTFLLAVALEYKKPILALFSKEHSGGKPSSTILATSKVNRLLTYKQCNDDTLDKTIKNYLSDVKRIVDTKFILIISPEIDRYLQWASENRRMHKAQVVRLALEEVMEKDKEYKAFVKSDK